MYIHSYVYYYAGVIISISEAVYTIKDFVTEKGYCFKDFRLHYTVYGTLNAQKDNIVWILHPLTATDDPTKWWAGIVGERHVFDPNRYCIICVNNPISPYGSISPLDINPKTQQQYLHDFPFISMKDCIRAFDILREHLEITKIRIACGTSMGGQLLYQWLVSYPESIRTAIIIAANAKISSWMVAYNYLQLQSIYSDPSWKRKDIYAGKQGLKLARQIAFLSFRSPIIFQLFQSVNMRLSNEADEQGFEEPFRIDDMKRMVSSYLEYQGTKFLERFNIFSYMGLLEMMNEHNIQGEHETIEKALGSIKADVLKIGIDSDILFYPREVKSVLPFIPKVQYREISSVYGHDAFLVEYKQMEDIIIDYLHQIDEFYLH